MYFAFLVPAFGAGPVQWSFGFGAPEADSLAASIKSSIETLLSVRMAQGAPMGGKGAPFKFVIDSLQSGVNPSILTNPFANSFPNWLARENGAGTGETSENAEIQVESAMTDKELAHLAELRVKIDELEALLLQAEGENGIDESPHDDIPKYY